MRGGTLKLPAASPGVARFAPVVAAIVFCLPSGSLSSDEIKTRADSRSLSERISAPDLSREIRVAEFRTGKARDAGTRESPQKQFYWVQRSLTKDFRTSSFQAGSQRQSFGHRVGSKKFGAGRAYFGEAASRTQTNEEFRTGEYGTAEARDAGREVRTGEARAVADKPFTGRGAAQGSLDQMGSGGEPLSVDQVREILNRNK